MKELTIGGVAILPGESKKIDLPVVRLYTDTEIKMPVYVKRSRKDGPVIFVSAAVHGDELNGVEIIRRLIRRRSLKLKKGTLIFVPMVNVYGVLNQSRYMPDRRDLNRVFPGSARGSLAGRLAHIFLSEIVSKCDYGIDLHTGAIHRSNLPQVRANLDDVETREMAEKFGVPVLLNSNLRDGSLRESAVEHGVKILLYEAGEALRFDELSIRAGEKGVLNVLAHLDMIAKRKSSNKKITPFIAYSSSWVRAVTSGFVDNKVQNGDQVAKGQLLAEIGDSFGEVQSEVLAGREGIIIGKQNIPLVQEGDAMFHIAYFKESDDVAGNIEDLADNLLDS
ncbi:MAG: putative deacylase [Oleispira sp.]|jgi:predicted deacylase